MKEWFKLTYVGIICCLIRHLILMQRQKARIGRQLYSDQMKSIICSYLNVRRLKKDWLGRLYCIVNPNLNEQGVFDTNLIIYEMDPQGSQFSNSQFVESWLVKKLRIIQDVFRQRYLFSQLDFQVSHVGPSNADNYLVVISPTEAVEVRYWIPKFLRRTLLLGAAAAVAVIFLF